jgi:hypothetical protein
VPWCASCDRFLSPSTVHADGTCPACGQPVDAGHAHHRATITDPTPAGEPPDAEEPLEPVPWHFKLLLGALAVYLGYRALQGIEWLISHL